jgi:geranylgeranyl reductase family protein
MTSDLQKFDICIVGGSIAGNYLAYLLATSDLDIAVIEEHGEIGLPLQCAGIVSQKLTKLIKLPQHIVLNQVNVAKIISPSGKFIKLRGDERPYVIDRVALDRHFFEKANKFKNITYFLDEKYKNFKYLFENHQKVLWIETNKRKIKARMLIGCDGPLSKISKSLGIQNKVIYATQIRIKARFNDNEAVMWFDPKWKELFGWIVPEGNQTYRIGIASSNNPSENFQEFLNRLNIDYEKRISQQGGIIPYGIMNNVLFDNILLLGDAAGQVKATTGGGIVMLLTAAKYAAYCLRRCFKDKDFSKKKIKKLYVNPCQMTIGKQLRIHFLIRTILASFTNRDFETLFKIVKSTKVEQIISLYGDMDFPRDAVFKLIRNSDFLLFLGKLLLKRPILLFKNLRNIKFLF